MASKDTFGLRLRAARERSGITLQSIASQTKVSVAIWEAMERSDFSRWPSGLFARSYVRDYARLVGLNPEEVVDEFCRSFPNGDRRRGALMQAHADVIDIRSGYRDDQLPAEGDRRVSRETVPAHVAIVRNERVQRLFGALTDVAAVVALALVIATALRVTLFPPLAIASVAYYAIGGALTGSTAGLKLAAMLGTRIPQLLSGGSSTSRFQAGGGTRIRLQRAAR